MVYKNSCSIWGFALKVFIGDVIFLNVYFEKLKKKDKIKRKKINVVGPVGQYNVNERKTFFSILVNNKNNNTRQTDYYYENNDKFYYRYYKHHHDCLCICSNNLKLKI